MRLARAFYIAVGLLSAWVPAYAGTIPLVTGPQDVSQMNAKINGVILNINTLLSPISGGFSTPANLIALSGAISGSPAVIGLQPGSDANGGINILPNGSGNIVLFGSGTTGSLQFANAAAFIPATGLTVCPSVSPGKAPLGVAPTVTGYITVQDWLGRPRALVAC